MSVFRNRMRTISNPAIAALFALMSLAVPYVHAGAGAKAINPHQETPPGGTFDGEFPPVPEVVRLSWDNLPNPDAVTVGPASRVVLRVANISRQSMRVELFCTADDGGQKSAKLQIGSFILDTSRTIAVRFNLKKFGFKLA
jgi:hypothetical protein